MTSRPYDPCSPTPKGGRIVYFCKKCGTSVPSSPATSLNCECFNIGVDVDAGRLAIRDGTAVEIWFGVAADPAT